MSSNEFANYDHWKTTPLEENLDPVAYCINCGKEMWPGDALYTIDGGICEDCLKDEYRIIL